MQPNLAPGQRRLRVPSFSEWLRPLKCKSAFPWLGAKQQALPHTNTQFVVLLSLCPKQMTVFTVFDIAFEKDRKYNDGSVAYRLQSIDFRFEKNV